MEISGCKTLKTREIETIFYTRRTIENREYLVENEAMVINQDFSSGYLWKAFLIYFENDDHH